MKKNFLLLVVVIGFGIAATAQDVITLKNGTDIDALVQKIGEVEIEYKKFDNPNGPNYTLRKSEIFMIKYANGSKDVFAVSVVEKNTQTDKKNENMNYAIFNIYRPGCFFGCAVRCNLYLDSKLICRLKNKSKTTIQIYTLGETTLSAVHPWKSQRKQKVEIPINVESGKEYYIQYGYCPAAINVDIVQELTGKSRFNSIKKTAFY
jgi:hypothetical protein